MMLAVPSYTALKYDYDDQNYPSSHTVAVFSAAVFGGAFAVLGIVGHGYIDWRMPPLLASGLATLALFGYLAIFIFIIITAKKGKSFFRRTV